ncbi:MAG: carbohydrate kinase family protein [Pyrinomonadaceae bacterium]
MQFPFQLLQTNDFDVVGFGTNAVDYLIRVTEYPAYDSKVELTDYSIEAGGEIATSMFGLHKLGLKTAYVGRFGGDQLGELGLQSLAEAGVNVAYVETIQAAKTQIAFIIIDEESGERTVIWQRDKKLAYSIADAPIEAAVRGRVLHLTPHDTQACIQLARIARDKGVVVSIDVDNLFDGIEELLSLVHICITSAEFPEQLLGMVDKWAALSEINSRFGCAVTGLTLGASGSLFLCQDSFIETPGFDVPGGCVDTTGAGDAFRTGFLYGMLKGETVEESALTANAVAALNCRSYGARSSLPDKSELNMLLKKV